MDFDDFISNVKNGVFFSFNEGSEKETHKRLRLELLGIAQNLGYAHPYFFDGDFPDVLRFNPVESKLFCGDAKDSENESAGKKESSERIAKYFERFVLALNAGVRGGIFAIATDTSDSADGWRLFLDEQLNKHQFTDAHSAIHRIRDDCWIAVC